MPPTENDQARPETPGPMHHIGVQTADFDNSVAWYRDFFGCKVNWTMEGGFSPLSHRRLPGISRLTELAVGDLRFHLFVRAGDEPAPSPADTNQFQHLCIPVASPTELRRWRAHWLALFHSGRYPFVRPEPASEIDVDAAGMQSFYAYDVNGLEFEFSYFPEGT